MEWSFNNENNNTWECAVDCGILATSNRRSKDGKDLSKAKWTKTV